jgi:hypothetical protein
MQRYLTWVAAGAAALLIPLVLVGASLGAEDDKDGDGIITSVDQCPGIAGIPAHDGCAEPYRVHSFVIEPKRKIRRKREFTPDAAPSPDRVIEIAALEQARWGGPSIVGRMQCESGLDHDVVNSGGYAGLLQFGPIWGSMYAVTPRDVKLRHTSSRTAPIRRITWWSDGRRQRTVIRRITQQVVTVKRGMLPADAGPTHGWSAIRVGQRAVSGDGPTTGWSCGL